ncbi:MAG: hypothetical protein PHY94_04395 [Candidatus Omnitrophica bacterium]|nr:hypothetical protein [Candidatus Omnitrophota bacterium]
MKDIKHRVITMLDRKELDFLDKLGKDALFSTGHKLSYNEILRGLIEFSIEIGLSGKQVDSEKKFKEKIIQQTLALLKQPRENMH